MGERELLSQAKQTVMQLEQACLRQRGYIDRSYVNGQLTRMSERIDAASRLPADIEKMRMSELAHAYSNVSDGKGGVDPLTQRDLSVEQRARAMDRYNNVLKGLNPDGNGYSYSQRAAIEAGQKGKDFLTDHVREAHIGRASHSEHVVVEGRGTSFAKSQRGMAAPGLVGKLAVGAVAIATVMAGGKVHAAEITDAMLPTNFTGEKSLCQQFGEMATAGASYGSGIGLGLISSPAVTPVGGALVGIATQATVEDAGNKLTALVCGPS